ERELGTADMQTLLGVIRGFADVLNLCGGEPLVRPDIELLARDAKRRHRFRTLLLSTNGVGIEKRTQLLGEIDYFLVSLDTLSDARGRPLWGGAPGTVDRVRDALEWLATERKRYRHQIVVNGVIAPD